MNVTSSIATLPIPKIIEEFQAKKLFSIPHFRERAHFHLSSFIDQFNETVRFFPEETILKMECIQVMRQWSIFTLFSNSIETHSSLLTTLEVNSLFLGEGLCAAATVEYFSRFFKHFSPLKSIPLPVAPHALHESDILFYPINLQVANLEEQTRHLRFLQSAYKVASSMKQADSFEYVPKKLLTQQQLKLVHRYPALNEKGKLVYPITELLKTLKNLPSQNHKKAGYLLGLAGAQNHSLALYLQPPYHFFDSRFGLAVSDNKEEFLLFLASFLTEKYPDHSGFALLEFTDARH